jgi:two-component sensor histidine kinase
MPRCSLPPQPNDHPLHAAAFTFVVAADISAPFEQINNTVRTFLATPERREDELHCVELIINAWATNLRKHGCGDGERHVATVTLKYLGARISLRFEDDCAPFDPTALVPPDLERGSGIRLIRSMVAELTYRRENGVNIWEMMR